MRKKEIMKKQRISICGSVLFMLLLMLATSISAQQSRVDSAIALLKKSNTAKGLDTATFLSARQLIRTTTLSDVHIIQIEKAAEHFNKGKDEDLCYAVKFVVLFSLSNSDKFRAIEYAKLNIIGLEKSATPRAAYIAKSFLSLMRLPYRNSSRVAEGFQYYTDKLNQYQKANDSIGISICYYVLGGFYRNIGLFEPAMYNMKKSISYLDSSDFNSQRYLDFTVNIGKSGWINNSYIICDFYVQMGEYEKAMQQGELTLKAAIDYYNAGGKGSSGAGLALTYGARHLALAKILTNQLDSVDYYLKLAEQAIANVSDFSALVVILQFRSLYNIKRGAYREADSLLQKCWNYVKEYKIPVTPASGFVEPDYYLALLRTEEKKYPEAIALLLKNIERIKAVRLSVLRDYKLLASLYEKAGDHLKAKEVYKSFISLQDSITTDQSKYRTISFETEQQITDNEIAISKLESKNKLSAQSRNFTIGIAVLLLILAGSIYYRFQSKKKANAVLERTLTELKSTQSQLIQSEKMASLGELTAGIAHEIQNPLNFVNNFSEVNSELISELVDEVDKGNTGGVKLIAADIRDNSYKINHHGKRADAIVKGMLQHSSSGSGKKEPTDINALADEYLRLAYHGLRAKDNSFNATMKTDFDPSIGNVNIVPQDIGRVILNLISNAFYAVNERLRQAQPDNTYEPTVEVSTKKTGNKIEVMVKDNGNGIPAKVLDKIFQPFFTTKPTGQGTGLGLSLSYDIVKAHGGELKVETTEGEGSGFIITLPV
jgi:two-component system, NtrC family, sensor kinase